MKAKGNVFFQAMVLVALVGTGIAVSRNMGRQSKSDMQNEKTGSKEITVTGTALHAKAGAVVRTDDGHVYYIRDKQDWGELYNKRVKVTGRLEVEHHNKEELKGENGTMAQGFGGDVTYITDAKVEEVK